MKKLLLIMILFTACKKESSSPAAASKSDCKICEVKVHKQVTNQPSTDYIESSTEYCNGTWKDYDGDYYHNVWTQSGTVTEITKRTECK